MRRRKEIKPTWEELRSAIRYTRSQFRIMFPKRKPYRHPEYKATVMKMAMIVAEHRHIRSQMVSRG